MIVFIHYKLFGKDGVSLEIDKRAKVLDRLGEEVGYICGETNASAADKNIVVIPELSLSHPEAVSLRMDMFASGAKNETKVVSEYHLFESRLQKSISQALQNLNPKMIFVHNMLAHAYNLPATTALIKVMDQMEIPTVAVHHDFWFERVKFLRPNHKFVEIILKSLPPKRGYIIRHQVINSLAQKELLERRQVNAEKIGDYFDFSQKVEQIDEYNKDLPKKFGIKDSDLIALQATRITPRKGIEIAVDFVAHMQKDLKKYVSAKINGKTIKPDSKIFLFLPNFVEVDDEEYAVKLQKRARKKEVDIIFAQDSFSVTREGSQNTREKIYSFWDAYVHADLVTYPSIWEGFGNQFLEAVFFRKLPITFEYPVFKKDIKPLGYQYISLGDQAHKNGLYSVDEEKIRKASSLAFDYLTNPEKLQKLTEKNFSLGRENHDFGILADSLSLLMKLARKKQPNGKNTLNGSKFAL